MTRRELVLKKLLALPDKEVGEAIEQLTHHVQARMRFNSIMDRTKIGAHGEKNLGMDAIDYYVGESVKKLYDPNGWDWKFEVLSLAEQLMRIANKLISDKVKSYKSKKDNLPEFDERDTSDIYDLDETPNDISDEYEEQCTQIINLAHELSIDDDNLYFFTIRYFENTEFSVIAKEMNLTIEQVYVLRKKLVRRLIKNSDKLNV